jgi:mono/diheme cytochrome c family protein
MKKVSRLGMLVVVLGLLGTAALAADAPDGKALFESKCGMCHGKDGVAKSTAKGAANLNDPKFQEANTAKAIETVIADGKGKMKGLKDKLTPEQITAIAAHVKTLK